MPKLNRSSHSLSHYRLSTFDMGYLVPVACVEVLMGDSFLHSASALIRAATLVTPVMHPVDVRIHHWYVPNRIIFDDWDELITGRDPDAVIPTVDIQSGGNYTLADHFGLQDDVGLVSALPFRAYNKIWNEFYRDQDLQTEVTEDQLAIQRIGWAKDYFTTSRLTPQQGTAISIPFAAGTEAPVRGIAFAGAPGATPVATGSDRETGGPPDTNEIGWGIEAISLAAGAAEAQLRVRQDPANLGYPLITADLAAASGAGIDVNDFRMAMAMQRHLEARNRWGSRIQDYLNYHGIRPRDGRLDLPEYLGGGKQTIAFSEVLATAEGTNTNVGDQAGHGIAAVRTRRYGRFMPESGWMLSLMSVRPRSIYSTQHHRMWMRSVKDDFWQKEYEAFGPQAVMKKEIFGNHASATEVFGYNGRHDEYRHHPSYITGLFRTTDHDWHMAREFVAAPALNASFIACDPTDRIYADTAEPEIRTMVNHNIQAKRLVSKRARY